MDWVLVLTLLLAIYIAVAAYVLKTGRFSEHISFYGPIMMIRTSRVGFFDLFKPISGFLRAYGTFGVVMVVLASIGMALMVVLSFQLTLTNIDQQGGSLAPQAVLLIPGLNPFIPSTVAVWLAFFVTLLVHECGHGVLCRIEDIKVKSAGLLYAVIPIGAFVEPDEEDVEKTTGMPKARMYGAGITNNIVLGAICIVLFVFLMGMVVPTTAPVVYGIYQDGPADRADLPTPAIITEVNGIDVSTPADVAAVLNTTRPGDTLDLVLENDGTERAYSLTLDSWPESITDQTGPRESGYMGIYYYQPEIVTNTAASVLSVPGFFLFISIPLAHLYNPVIGQHLLILTSPSPDIQFFTVPFPFFWEVIHLLFWMAWININVGIFNAIPMLPLDGGYILKEGLDRVLEPRGLKRYSQTIMSAITWTFFALIATTIWIMVFYRP
ncbi:PDZ domain-containing protein [Methanofollis formosanus]|uniref:PDZ domain-containing protein n=1 Tax=Methanofollis formosanus TaxID=299308 RepID=A0A8G1EGD6_9EURY|nr:site-2 protease family protein [Methanofollis formosanus]QYZ78812.1 PDZ domain-containing protein [Methanofollis formosanus]